MLRTADLDEAIGLRVSPDVGYFDAHRLWSTVARKSLPQLYD
jgi:hypothetical protein